VPQVHRSQPAFPARWLYGFLRALLGDRAFLSPSPLRSVASQGLDASNGASGPHDFAVRFSTVRPRGKRATTPSRPPHPVPTFVTMANAPLSEQDAAQRRLICLKRKAEFISREGWTGFADLPLRATVRHSKQSSSGKSALWGRSGLARLREPANCNFGQSRCSSRGRKGRPELGGYARLPLDDQRRLQKFCASRLTAFRKMPKAG
jgi:hypothetical protein